MAPPRRAVAGEAETVPGANGGIVTISVSSGGGFTEPASIFTGSIMLPTALFSGVALINGLTVGNLANSSKFIAPGNPAGPRAERVLRAGGGLGGFGPLTGQAFVNVLTRREPTLGAPAKPALRVRAELHEVLLVQDAHDLRADPRAAPRIVPSCGYTVAISACREW
jgi:hypothetical protein